MSEQEYRELHPGEIIQPGDEFCVSIGQDRWQPYPTRRDGSRVSASSLARRPIGKTNQTAFEEVPGSRTTQQAIDQPQRERIAYEELQVGDVIQDDDEWQNADGRWQRYLLLPGSRVLVRQSQRARRPYKISTIQEIGDALATAQKAATQLQQERDELRAEMDTVKGDRMNLREALTAEQRAHTVTMASGLAACKERDEACNDRDLARSEVARLSTELWARKPLEERVASLTEELANAREDIQKLVKTNADNADQFAEHTKFLVQERDEARAERDRLQEVVGNLYSEPTARQVQDMLRTWATELDWSGCCFDSTGRDKVSAVQRVLVAVIERVETMINPEGGTDDN